MWHARMVRYLMMYPVESQPTHLTDISNKAGISICKNIYYQFIKSALLCKFIKVITDQLQK